MVEKGADGAGSAGEESKECSTQVAYALLLENLKQATNLSVKNADTERALNKKANLNYRLKKQIETARMEQKNQDDDMKV